MLGDDTNLKNCDCVVFASQRMRKLSLRLRSENAGFQQ